MPRHPQGPRNGAVVQTRSRAWRLVKAAVLLSALRSCGHSPLQTLLPRVAGFGLMDGLLHGRGLGGRYYPGSSGYHPVRPRQQQQQQPFYDDEYDEGYYAPRHRQPSSHYYDGAHHRGHDGHYAPQQRRQPSHYDHGGFRSPARQQPQHDYPDDHLDAYYGGYPGGTSDYGTSPSRPRQQAASAGGRGRGRWDAEDPHEAYARQQAQLQREREAAESRRHEELARQQAQLQREREAEESRRRQELDRRRRRVHAGEPADDYEGGRGGVHPRSAQQQARRGGRFASPASASATPHRAAVEPTPAAAAGRRPHPGEKNGPTTHGSRTEPTRTTSRTPMRQKGEGSSSATRPTPGLSFLSKGKWREPEEPKHRADAGIEVVDLGFSDASEPKKDPDVSEGYRDNRGEFHYY